MNSWDCFDTLIARKYRTPESIFEEVSKRINDPGFTKKRRKAEKLSNKTYADIYSNLPGIDPQVELDVELEHCYPIRSNINKVKDGDYIISDMYLPDKVILKMLKKCGLDKKINLVVTPSGKKDGTIWKTLPQIECHFGDNLKGDVKSPARDGIKSKHVIDSFQTDMEKLVEKYDKNLSCFMRYVRLQCPYDDSYNRKLWQDQTDYNLPVLILGTLGLPKNTKICFTMRDCVYWQKIYHALTGKKSETLHSSRKMYYYGDELFKKYVQNTVLNCQIVDLKGSGKSPNYFFNKKQNVLYLVGTNIEQPCNSISGSGSWMDTIERLNITDQGPLTRVVDGIPKRDQCEHNLEIVKIFTEVNDIICKNVKMYTVVFNQQLLREILDKTGKIFTRKAVKTIFNSKSVLKIDGNDYIVSI